MAEVTIRGAGIFGLSIAWACLQRGAKVRVIDPNGIAAGASGGVVGALAPHVPENWNVKKEFQRDSLIASRTFWPEVDAISGLDSGYSRLGRLQPILNERGVALAHQRVDGAREHWQGLAEWRVVDHVPAWVPPSPMGLWIFDDMSARINPALACASLARALEKGGCEFAADGPERGHVIWAAGADDLVYISNAKGTDMGRGEKGQAAVFDIDLRDNPQLYIDSLHIIPHADGTTAIGSTSERFFDDPTGNDGLLDDLIVKARDLVPALRAAKVIQKWSGLRPRSKTRAPVLGPHPVRDGAFIANGGFKIGFGMAVGVGRVMADYVLDGHDAIPHAFHSHRLGEA